MEAPSAIATHEDPVWRAKADFLVHADLAAWNMPGRWEQLWVRRADVHLVELCCIPFFTYGFRLGDLLETAPASGQDFMVQRVVQPGGRNNIRVVVPDANERESIGKLVVEVLDRLSCLYEIFKPGYVSADLQSGEVESGVLDALSSLRHDGQVRIEQI